MKFGRFLFEAASKTGAARIGTATGGTTSTLVDTAREEQADFWQGGTLFVFSGDNDGLIEPVSYSNGSEIGINKTLAKVIASGNEYGLVQPKFTLNLLKHAANNAITSDKHITTDESLVVVADQEAYDLPSGVGNVKRVEIAANAASPYEYETNYYWYEANGKLYFDTDQIPSEAGNKIRLWYMGQRTALALTADLPEDITYEWVLWQTVVNLWRYYLQQVEKDDPIAMEMLNEANANLAQANQRRLNTRTMNRDVRLASW